jgi:uncharacterized protein (DUF2267 family)
MTANALVRTTEKTNVWLNELAEELLWDDQDLVFKVLRVVLHELRDRLPTNESAQLASQLPMLIRGCYYENWVPRPRPNHLHAEDFLARVGQAFPTDFTIDPERVTVAVFRLISRHVSEGEIKDVQSCLPEDIQDLWPS